MYSYHGSPLSIPNLAHIEVLFPGECGRSMTNFHLSLRKELEGNRYTKMYRNITLAKVGIKINTLRQKVTELIG